MQVTKFETNFKRKLFLKESNINFKTDTKNEENNLINIYPDIVFQEFLGFGGALTGSTCYNLSTCKNEIKKEILDEYFSNNKMNYSICRISIGSSDFNNKSYSYSNKKDLTDFSINEDLKYVVPIIKEALKQNMHLKFLASCWSPPSFMKDNQKLTNGGKLLPEFKQTYAKYLVKFIKAYEKENINIDYITIQNEPNAKQIWESCLYSPLEELDLIKNYVYPEFIKNNINTKILLWDHNKEKLISRYLNQNITKEISGFAFHWYTGDHFENIELLKNIYPTKLLFHTEGCTGFSMFRKKDEIKNAEIYAHDIIGDLNAGVNSYIDWNMVLNNIGGPNHKLNFCNSPIMLNLTKNKYVKNLSFYYISHFARFIKPKSKRIGYSKFSDKIEVTAFKNLDNSDIIVLLNKSNKSIEYNLKINNQIFHDNLDKHSIVTLEVKYDR